jgi:hypothetical protein
VEFIFARSVLLIRLPEISSGKRKKLWSQNKNQVLFFFKKPGYKVFPGFLFRLFLCIFQKPEEVEIVNLEMLQIEQLKNGVILTFVA